MKDCSIKLEAGFYNNRLIEYLHDVRYMSLKTVKYIAHTKKAIKPIHFLKMVCFSRKATTDIKLDIHSL